MGALGIVSDGRGVPHAVVVTTQVEIVPFDEVSAEHAYFEGWGDRSLARTCGPPGLDRAAYPVVG